MILFRPTRHSRKLQVVASCNRITLFRYIHSYLQYIQMTLIIDLSEPVGEYGCMVRHPDIEQQKIWTSLDRNQSKQNKESNLCTSNFHLDFDAKVRRNSQTEKTQSSLWPVIRKGEEDSDTQVRIFEDLDFEIVARRILIEHPSSRDHHESTDNEYTKWQFWYSDLWNNAFSAQCSICVDVVSRCRISDHLILAHRNSYIGPSESACTRSVFTAHPFPRIIHDHWFLVKTSFWQLRDTDENGDPLSDEASFRSNSRRKCPLARINRTFGTPSNMTSMVMMTVRFSGWID